MSYSKFAEKDFVFLNVNDSYYFVGRVASVNKSLLRTISPAFVFVSFDYIYDFAHLYDCFDRGGYKIGE